MTSKLTPWVFWFAAALLLTTIWTRLALDAAVLAIAALLSAGAVVAYHAPSIRNRLYLLALVLPSVGLLSLRSLLGKYDLGNLPQQFDVTRGQYDRAALLASGSVLVSLLGYVVADALLRRTGRRSARPRRDSRRDSPTRLAIAGLIALGLSAVLTIRYGVGVKGSKVDFPLQGYLSLGTSAVIRLAATALLIHGFVNRIKIGRNIGMTILIGDLALGTFAGGRGELFHVIFLALGAALVAMRGRRDRRTVGMTVIGGLLLVVPLTQIGLARRLEITPGREFTAGEFLALRISGMNRVAPVVATGEQRGLSAITDTRRTINHEIYGFALDAQTGVGSPAIGVGYLAAGVVGLLLIGMFAGLLAAWGDARARQARSLVWIAFHVVTAELLLDAVSSLRPQFNLKVLISLLVCAAALDRWAYMRFDVDRRATGGVRAGPADRLERSTP